MLKRPPVMMANRVTQAGVDQVVAHVSFEELKDVKILRLVVLFGKALRETFEQKPLESILMGNR